MFIARGRTVAFHYLHREALRDILRHYIDSGFTGRLVVRTPSGGAEIELLGGRVVGVVAEGGGSVTTGPGAIGILEKLAGSRDGFVEVVELTDEKVAVDMETLPQARVDHEDVARALLRDQPARQEPPGPRRAPPKATIARGRDPAEVARNPAELLRIVLRGRKGRTVRVYSTQEAAETLRDEMDMAAAEVGYARCVTTAGLGVNVVCAGERCVAVDIEGRPAGDREEEMECEIYLAPD